MSNVTTVIFTIAAVSPNAEGELVLYSHATCYADEAEALAIAPVLAEQLGLEQLIEEVEEDDAHFFNYADGEVVVRRAILNFEPITKANLN